MHVLPRLSLACCVASTLITAALSPAAADPPPGVTPAHPDIVGVGSDVTQGLMNQIALDYDAQSVVPTRKAYSFDAAGSTSIVTKADCAAITRPASARAGMSALAAGATPMHDSGYPCIDFARWDHRPDSGTSYAYVAFAQDATTWSATTSTAKPTRAPSALSILELRAIYSCNASIIRSTYPNAPVTWNQVGGTGTRTVVPVIPPAGSGTRAFFLAAIGVTTVGSCVTPTDDSVSPNEGTNPIFAGTNSQDLIFPYSVGVYLAQSEHGHGAGTQGNQVLGSVINSATPPAVIAPTTGTAPNAVINPTLSTVGLTTAVYNVVRSTGASPYIPAYLQPLFTAAAPGYLCNNPTAQADITDYGFRLLNSNCGTVVLGGI